MSVEWATMFVGAVIGALLTLAAVRTSRNDARRLAIESGALRMPKIDVSLFGHAIKQDGITIWFVHPGPSDATAIFSCPLVIHNSGDRATGELLVTITGPKGMIAPADVIGFEAAPAVLATEMRRSVATHGNFCQSSYVVPSLAPTTGAQIEEAFWLQPNQEIPGVADVRTKDGVAMRVQYALNMKCIVSVLVSSQEAAPLILKVGVKCILKDDSGKIPTGITATYLQDVIKKFNGMPRRDRLSHRLVTKKGLCVTFDVDRVIQGKKSKVILMNRVGTMRSADTLSIAARRKLRP